MPAKKKKYCLECKESFDYDRASKKFCSDVCRDKYNNSGERKEKRNKKYRNKELSSED